MKVFSIIVPTLGRPKPLAACLRALAHLNYPKELFEVIVVDDGNEAPPASTVESFARALKIALVAQPHAGPAAARNAGAAKAGGEYLAFTDDDCAPDSRWLSAFDAVLQTRPGACVGGQTINALPDNPYSAASQSLIAYLYTQWNPSTGSTFFASNNVAVPSAPFKEIGGFDARFAFAAGEDRDFCDRWLGCGFRMAYAPEAIVYHSHALGLRSFWRQHYNYGRGAFQFRRLRAERLRQSIRLEPASFYMKLAAQPAAQVGRRRGMTVAFLMVLAQIASTAGFVWERWNSTR